ncbi:hypothetical protein ACN20G_36760 (plasmid) [Streptomyces sp. BI20]|uniref:hypothetical protein n=1 Tax=Streptomyces sp. BI20 TaxID=3403460 RepID=UPI003C775699
MDVAPGVTVSGLDVGAWPARQRQVGVWARLVEGQREQLVRLGVVPEAPAAEVAAEPRRAPRAGAFERGLAALDAHLARTGELHSARPSRCCRTGRRLGSGCGP